MDFPRGIQPKQAVVRQGLAMGEEWDLARPWIQIKADGEHSLGLGAQAVHAPVKLEPHQPQRGNIKEKHPAAQGTTLQLQQLEIQPQALKDRLQLLHGRPTLGECNRHQASLINLSKQQKDTMARPEKVRVF
jgi:hypothetical protein